MPEAVQVRIDDLVLRCHFRSLRGHIQIMDPLPVGSGVLGIIFIFGQLLDQEHILGLEADNLIGAELLIHQDGGPLAVQRRTVQFDIVLHGRAGIRLSVLLSGAGRMQGQINRLRILLFGGSINSQHGRGHEHGLGDL